MSDLVASNLSSGWSWYVAIATIISLLACVWVLRVNSVKKVSSDKPELHGKNEWDGLREYDNPLPRWWSNLFYITIIFSFGYLVLYPGLIVVPGILGWSTSTLYADEIKQAKAETDPIFDAYIKQDVKTVSLDKGALQIGARLFQTYCTQCHGTDMRGSKGFPNLVDNDWLYPGTPDGIKTTILEGRTQRNTCSHCPVVQRPLPQPRAERPRSNRFAQHVMALTEKATSHWARRI